MTVHNNPADGSNDPLSLARGDRGRHAPSAGSMRRTRAPMPSLCDDAYQRRLRRRADDPQCRRPHSRSSASPATISTISGRTPQHPRGLWRRTTLESYETDTPDWDVLLDIDALNKAEGISWAFAGAARSPDKTRALISLSFNGTDAIEVREFDIATKSFVADGFVIPKAKTQASWLDQDTLLLGSAQTPDDTTEAGYARIVRKWTRGTPLGSAETVFEVEKQDVAAWFGVNRRPSHERVMYWRALDFTRSHIFVERQHGPHAGQRLRLDLPEEDLGLGRRRRSAGQPEAGLDRRRASSIPTGALAVDRSRPLPVRRARFRDRLHADADARAAVLGGDAPRHRAARFSTMSAAASCWRQRSEDGWIETRTARPARQRLDLGAAFRRRGRSRSRHRHAAHRHRLRPADHDGAVERPWRAGAAEECAGNRSIAEGIEVQQCHAVAADGTKIPYFLIGKNLSAGGPPRPTILYGYGGFEVSLTPSYHGHHRQAVARTGPSSTRSPISAAAASSARAGTSPRARAPSMSRMTTSPAWRAISLHPASRRRAKLACHGGSNGGLLVGNMLTRYPELFGAIWCSVPLLDMARYTKLLAGQSWIAEYGDPEIPEEWAYLQKYLALSPDRGRQELSADLHHHQPHRRPRPSRPCPQDGGEARRSSAIRSGSTRPSPAGIPARWTIPSRRRARRWALRFCARRSRSDHHCRSGARAPHSAVIARPGAQLRAGTGRPSRRKHPRVIINAAITGSPAFAGDDNWCVGDYAPATPRSAIISLSLQRALSQSRSDSARAISSDAMSPDCASGAVASRALAVCSMCAASAGTRAIKA